MITSNIIIKYYKQILINFLILHKEDQIIKLRKNILQEEHNDQYHILHFKNKINQNWKKI